jgi:hypothetical protein
MYGKQPRFLVVIRRVNSYYVFAGLNFEYKTLECVCVVFIQRINIENF